MWQGRTLVGLRSTRDDNVATHKKDRPDVCQLIAFHYYIGEKDVIANQSDTYKETSYTKLV